LIAYLDSMDRRPRPAHTRSRERYTPRRTNRWRRSSSEIASPRSRRVGRVVRQSPRPGVARPRGFKITLVVCRP